MSKAAYSTAVSDAVLALTGFFAAYQLNGSNNWATVAFLSVALAASAGVVRFSLDNPGAGILTTHKLLTFVSTVVIGPFIAISNQQANQTILTCIAAAFILSIVVKCADIFLNRYGKGIATTIVSGLGIIVTVLWNIWTLNVFGIAGGLLYVLAGIVVGTDGEMGGIPCVDIFHYILAIANIFLLWSL